TLPALSSAPGVPSDLCPGSNDSVSNGAAAGGSSRYGVLRSASGGGPPDRSAHPPVVDNDRRRAQLARACSPGATSRMGAEEGDGRRGDPNGVGALRGP